MDDDHEKETEPGGIDRWILPFVQDSSLWPVSTVMVLCLSTVGAAVLLAAWIGRDLFAIAALVVMIGLSGDIALRARRGEQNSILAWGVLVLWVGSFAGAVIGIAAGIV